MAAPAPSGADTFTKIVAPTLGLILSNAMFMAPLSQVRAVRRSGSLGALNPLPYPVIFMNCVLWCLYGAFKQDYFLFFSNSQGVVLGVWFTLSCLPLLDSKRRLVLEQVMTGCTATLVFVGLLAGLAVHPALAAERFVGGAATAAALAYYAAPLSTAYDVVRTRNAASLSLPLCLASLSNAAAWSIYGAAMRDPAILTPNVPGIAAGLLQLALLARFGRGSPASGGGGGGGSNAKESAGAGGAGVSGSGGGYDRLVEAEGGLASGGGGVSARDAPAGLREGLPAGRTASVGSGDRTLSPRRASVGKA